MGHLQIFGTTTFMLIPQEKRTKLDSKTLKTIFVGYCENSKAYRLYDPSSRKIIKSRDVYFNNEDKPKDIGAESKEDSVVVSLKEENIFKDTREENTS